MISVSKRQSQSSKTPNSTQAQVVPRMKGK